MRNSVIGLFAASSVMALVVAGPVLAQATASSDPAVIDPAAPVSQPGDEDQTTIIVTGTQIRGIAPPGSNIVALSSADIEASGATNSAELIAKIPQASTFGNLTSTLPGGGTAAGISRVPIARPNLRNLPGCGGAVSGSCTLILLDGRRLVPSGVEQTAVDPAIIPPGIIGRVETILDGASAIYGSDAIGGVLNFIPEKAISGVKADARVGFGKGYRSFDANVTAGYAWDTGSVTASYSYGHNDPVYSRDRDYITSRNFSTGLLATESVTGNYSCVNPTIRQTVAGVTTFYRAQDLAVGQNLCDVGDDGTFYPEITRHSVFAAFEQQLGENLTFKVDGLFSDYKSWTSNGPIKTNATLQPTNPNYRDINGPAANAAYTVFFSTEPALGADFLNARINIQTWQVTPQLKLDLAGGWQVRALGTYGESTTQLYQNSSIIAGSLASAVTAGTINPFNITAADRALLESTAFINRFDRTGIHKMWNARIIGDGPLFTLPGGEVRASIGAEYLKTQLARRTIIGGAFTEGSVTAKSLFGELFVPVFGPENETAGLHRLNLSLSGRYDHYDAGVGGTFNPKLALTYQPAEWVTVRASWGKSFNAPTAADRVGQKAAINPTVIPCGGSPCLGAVPYDAIAFPLAYVVAVTGATNQNLENQTAKNWALGLDLRPLPGLTISGTYYDIKIKNLISLPSLVANQLEASNLFPELYGKYPLGTPFDTPAILNLLTPLFTPAQIATARATVGSNPVIFTSDGRTRNLANFHVTGLDLSVAYQTDTAFGSIDLRFNGNYRIKRDFQPHEGDPVTDFILVDTTPKFTSATTLGANVGDAFRGQITWNHIGPARFNARPTDLQSSFPAYDTFDLFFRYKFGGDSLGFGKGLAFTLNVNDVFDTDPPVYRSTNGANLGYATNIRTLGRIVQLGVNAEF